jgi:hypothetical protein
MGNEKTNGMGFLSMQIRRLSDILDEIKVEGDVYDIVLTKCPRLDISIKDPSRDASRIGTRIHSSDHRL